MDLPAFAPPPDPRLHDAARAGNVRARLPASGLFAGMNWRTATAPFALSPRLARELEGLGRVLLQFYRAANLLYRRSSEGKAPPWIADWLDRGKPADLVALQRDPALRNELPRVIRPDILVTDQGMAITELDSVPGGIGLTTWLYEAYESTAHSAELFIGSSADMRRGFAGIFGRAPRVHVVVSEESGTYRPEMEWMCQRLRPEREGLEVHAADFSGWNDGDAVYRFFELFDVANVPSAPGLFEAARERRIQLTPPPRPVFEEKLWFALFWNRHLRDHWRRELGDGFFQRLQRLIPYSWAVDPAPLPPHAAIPQLDLSDWSQLKQFSQRERDLILKVSGFSEHAWGARGVYLGSDLSASDWSAAVDRALASWPQSPWVLQRYERPAIVHTAWAEAGMSTAQPLAGRVRLCPYYFVTGEGDAARPHLGGVLATICPADKKIIHGMQDAVLAPCVAATEDAPDAP